jgi:protein-disulfide isomerase
MTYAATFVMLVSSILILKNNIHSIRGSFFMSMMQHIRKYGLSMALIVIVLGAGGMGIGAGAKLIARGTKAVSLEDRIKEAIRQYETAETVDIDMTGVPFLGKKNAPAHFTMFFDFTCDHCQDEILLLDRLMKSNLGAVSISFKFLPLNGDCGSLDKGRNNPSADACIAAAASYCAYKQGRFMDYAKSLFELYHVNGASFTSKSVRELAKSKKLDMSVFDACFSSTVTREFIVRQCRESEKLGVAATPTLYLNGKLLTDGSRKPEILEKLIQYCVKRDKSK